MFLTLYINTVHHLLSYCLSSLKLLFCTLFCDAEPKIAKYISALPATTQPDNANSGTKGRLQG